MPQRSLRAEQFLHTDFLGTETNRHRENCTDRLHKGKYAPKFLHAETLPRTVFTQQKLFRTETFPDSFFSCTAIFAQHSLHTDVFIHRCRYTEDELHTETYAHFTLLHATNFFTQRFCFPFLITYLSCSPSQVYCDQPWYTMNCPLSLNISKIFTVMNHKLTIKPW